ncbi:hypothetical protein BS17DRAFT_785965 [Gyrodon lividus]|nr:hypothetical protein BS17DRAFT_785965 [Gyrodon lividus]
MHNCEEAEATVARGDIDTFRKTFAMFRSCPFVAGIVPRRGVRKCRFFREHRNSRNTSMTWLQPSMEVANRRRGEYLHGSLILQSLSTVLRFRSSEADESVVYDCS